MQLEELQDPTIILGYSNQFIADEFDNQTAIESLKEQIELDLSMKGEK